MAEVWFYQLTASPLEQTLPNLLERSLERGWRVLLRCGSAAGMEELDALLWTYRDASFLPHGTSRRDHADRQPIYLTIGDENPNRARILMLVDGARAAPEEMREFERTCLVFDGNDAPRLEEARRDWRAVRAAGLPAKYWAQEDGRWIQKASG
ncbi:DNA polymerase III subunit chi [Amaricoccus sp.]|uniref:DNA polymerase III subunit chi n=1 Tax=Amaricoccus sp. TaxID=1872485 RepID=UPI002618479E|nr:DNA polymerase III subunit chi [uncultured Amaricoccus sp.]